MSKLCIYAAADCSFNILYKLELSLNFFHNSQNSINMLEIWNYCARFLPLLFSFFLISYVGERPWWPIQCLNKGRKKKAKG